MKIISTSIFLLFTSISLIAQQGFFLDDSWTEKNSEIPLNESVVKTTSTPNVNVSVDFSNEITKVSPYLFGHCVSQFYSNYYHNDELLKNIKNLSPNVLRYPGGSGSNIFYWNRSKADGPPVDVSVDKFKYGISDDSTYMTNENFYTLCEKSNASGVNVVNYSYARFGTSENPVAVAAHLAADWVRYDNGRTKYWEIGNENYGKWEEGYEIDISQNKDGQPAIQTGTLYGKHFHVFADSMRNAASEIGVEIKIGAVCYHDNEDPWNHEVISEIGNNTDFLIVHRYLGRKNADADYKDLLDVASEMDLPYYTLTDKVNELGLKPIPVALTEWNFNYEKAGQKVSYLGGMFNTIAMGKIIEAGYGLATRWNLVWKSNEGITHGLFNANKDSDEGLDYFRPRPVFYYLYYFQKFFGDKMIKCQSDNDNVTSFASSFSDGNSSVILVNKSTSVQTVKVNMANYVQGANYYWYVLSGDTDDGSFSRKLYVNGQNSEDLSGPINYEEIKAYSCQQDGEILIELPPLSTLFALVEGSVTTGINNIGGFQDLIIYPNPATENVQIQFDLDQDSEVSVNVYDITGRRIENLFTGYKMMGKHILSWDNISKNTGSLFILEAEINGELYREKIVIN